MVLVGTWASTAALQSVHSCREESWTPRGSREQGKKEGKKRKEKKSRKEGKVEECAAPLPLRCVAFKPFIRALQGRFSRLHRRNLEPPHVPLFLLSFHSSPPTSPPPPFDGGRAHHCPFGFKRARYGLVIVSLARAQLLQLGVSTGGRVIWRHPLYTWLIKSYTGIQKNELTVRGLRNSTLNVSVNRSENV